MVDAICKAYSLGQLSFKKPIKHSLWNLKTGLNLFIQDFVSDAKKNGSRPRFVSTGNTQDHPWNTLIHKVDRFMMMSFKKILDFSFS